MKNVRYKFTQIAAQSVRAQISNTPRQSEKCKENNETEKKKIFQINIETKTTVTTKTLNDCEMRVDCSCDYHLSGGGGGDGSGGGVWLHITCNVRW